MGFLTVKQKAVEVSVEQKVANLGFVVAAGSLGPSCTAVDLTLCSRDFLGLRGESN